jgi:hypothetical protein
MATNPSKDLYITYVAREVTVQAPGLVCDGLQTLPTDRMNPSLMKPLTLLCNSALEYGVSLSSIPIKAYVEQQTVRQNLIVFSLYTTRFPGKTLKAVGIFNTFIPYKAQNS